MGRAREATDCIAIAAVNGRAPLSLGGSHSERMWCSIGLVSAAGAQQPGPDRVDLAVFDPNDKTLESSTTPRTSALSRSTLCSFHARSHRPVGRRQWAAG